ncbi:MAG: aspartate--tRNA ligase [Candidatus Yanofskybacteria bacterium CG10_big_fil_rev_8_21_14_0_10_37_15]|uniref:Aspartate--tRNA ligase n=1 Tax=Candidatus Yanofskybacteria bacterium CG10_big_fil_rev_8_21_14_0_10_37_15 TaxID=1975097 RepID=A0A2H0R5Q3_9BACT|nr:MAG: aspartate--tRNA ligase [Candidatus Yanofskybacteria bacterium CG10_big_fil_rev_8_21_14_0_10_37_15]
MQRTQIIETQNLVGQEVNLFGWVNVRRDQGKIIFIDLRDRSGVIQMVFVPSHKDLFSLAEKLRPEWVIRVKGLVKDRPEKMVNPDISTGRIEIEPSELEILNEATSPVFPIDTDGYEINEEVRMKYRYQDLRRLRMTKNLIKRHEIIHLIRNWLSERGFLEIETPILTKSTPEGARDYVVPSRLYAGKFYALPQSPQQYKQLLMAGGLEKYFQIARCFRDEDTRGDRQPEFTQLDMEMSFVKREDVMDINEKLLIEIVEKLYPDKKIQEKPFPRLSYKDVMEKYKTDRPDLREDKNNSNLLAFCWVVDFPFFSAEGGPASGGETKWTFTHNPFSAPVSEHKDDLLNEKNLEKIITTQYDVVLNGLEIGGGSIRAHESQILKTVFRLIGVSNIESSFGHMLHALDSGVPPHGGIAWGLDRLISILQNEPNIREVIAFPKTGDVRDLMMESPSELEPKQLKELHLKTVSDN